jgi:hypothetical protein
VLTIVPLKGHEGIVDSHDFFVESYWHVRESQRIQVTEEIESFVDHGAMVLG